jgi:hypothetical protein
MKSIRILHIALVIFIYSNNVPRSQAVCFLWSRGLAELETSQAQADLFPHSTYYFSKSGNWFSLYLDRYKFAKMLPLMVFVPRLQYTHRPHFQVWKDRFKIRDILAQFGHRPHFPVSPSELVQFHLYHFLLSDGSTTHWQRHKGSTEKDQLNAVHQSLTPNIYRAKRQVELFFRGAQDPTPTDVYVPDASEIERRLDPPHLRGDWDTFLNLLSLRMAMNAEDFSQNSHVYPDLAVTVDGTLFVPMALFYKPKLFKHNKGPLPLDLSHQFRRLLSWTLTPEEYKLLAELFENRELLGPHTKTEIKKLGIDIKTLRDLFVALTGDLITSTNSHIHSTKYSRQLKLLKEDSPVAYAFIKGVFDLK